ncbi:hypothetical protein HK100_008691 [Physocladia obscura]|uniref:RBR-type E3 ubiquitin transferase n=1 Tax=Physocladia obscura TaxID=109957 RepID=A0AAD5XHX1_9FUNG|nr:hypothetical protein HK100_008691 [Physocladia obscura]
MSCVYFTRGHCRNGTSCSFSHASPIPVTDTAAAAANHTATSIDISGMKPCSFFRKGTCERGVQCPFSHNNTGGKADTATCAALFEGASSSSIPALIRCRFNLLGSCTKAECPFKHETSNKAADQHVKSASRNALVPCKFDQRGLCTREACLFYHKPKTLVPRTNIKPAPTESGSMGEKTILYAGTTSAVIGDGLEVTRLKFSLKTNGVLIELADGARPLLQSINRDSIQELCAGFGKVSFVSPIKDRALIVFFELDADAKDCVDALHDSTHPGIGEDLPLRLSVTAYTKEREKPDIRDTALKVSWFRPTSVAVVTMRKIDHGGAEFILRGFAKLHMDGLRISIVPQHRKTHIYESSFYLTNLPAAVTSDEVRALFKPFVNDRNVVNVKIKPAPFQEDCAGDLISAELNRISRDALVSFAVRPMISGGSSTKQKGLAVFRTGADAALVVRELQDVSLPKLGNQRLRFEPLFSMRKLLLAAVKPFVRADIMGLKEQWPNVRCEFLTSPTSPLFAVLSINSNVSADLAAVSGQVSSILRGRVLKIGNEIVWHVFFETAEGVLWINDITKTTGGFIYRDLRIKSLSFFGRREIFETILDQIRTHLEFLATRENIIVVDVMSMRRLFALGVQGLKNLESTVNATSISLDITHGEVRVNGPDTSERGIRDWLNNPRHAIVSVNGTEVTCMVCLCECDVGETVHFACGHHACSGCLRRYLDQPTLPTSVTCLEKGCDVKMPLNLLEAHAANFPAVARAAVTKFIERRGDAFRFCPTPDCAQVYAVTAEPATITCDLCNTDLCTKCAIEEHAGFGCEEFVELRKDVNEIAFLKWKRDNDVRLCPRPGCGASIEKNGGCKHMTCKKCEAHICWTCMGMFAQNMVYTHMAKCGGTYE